MHLISFFTALPQFSLPWTDLLISFLYAQSFHYSFMTSFFMLLFFSFFLPTSCHWIVLVLNKVYESNVMKSQANSCLNVHPVWYCVFDKLFQKVPKYFGSWNCELIFWCCRLIFVTLFPSCVLSNLLHWDFRSLRDSSNKKDRDKFDSKGFPEWNINKRKKKLGTCAWKH